MRAIVIWIEHAPNPGGGKELLQNVQLGQKCNAPLADTKVILKKLAKIKPATAVFGMHKTNAFHIKLQIQSKVRLLGI